MLQQLASGTVLGPIILNGMSLNWRCGALIRILCIASILTIFPAVGQQSLDRPPMPSLLVNVIDRDGNVVPNLTKESFRLHLDGKPAAILNAQYSLAPRRVVVLLDMSGSMGGQRSTDQWQIANAAVEQLLAQTTDKVPVAMLTFAEVVHDRFSFSDGRTAISKWLTQGRKEQPKSKTALFDAILEGLKLLQPFREGDTIYAITDGGENGSRVGSAMVADALLRSGVRLFTLIFAGPPTPDWVASVDLRADPSLALAQMPGRRQFLNTVEESGGSAFGICERQIEFGPVSNFAYVYDAITKQKIKLYTQQLNFQVHGFWSVNIASNLSSEQHSVKFSIVDRSGKARKNLQLVYPHALAAN